jgi:hypothetical protein
MRSCRTPWCDEDKMDTRGSLYHIVGALFDGKDVIVRLRIDGAGREVSCDICEL